MVVDPRGSCLRSRRTALAASRSHLRGCTHALLRGLCTAIDDAFARWDRSHLNEFRFRDGRKIGTPDTDWGIDERVADYRKTKLSLLEPGEDFIYIFDFGDDWTHLCTVADVRINPLETLGIVPDQPLPYWGWGDIPDQYGRRWDGDDGESRPPDDPGDVDGAELEHWRW